MLGIVYTEFLAMVEKRFLRTCLMSLMRVLKTTVYSSRTFL